MKKSLIFSLCMATVLTSCQDNELIEPNKERSSDMHALDLTTSAMSLTEFQQEELYINKDSAMYAFDINTVTSNATLVATGVSFKFMTCIGNRVYGIMNGILYLFNYKNGSLEFIATGFGNASHMSGAYLFLDGSTRRVIYTLEGSILFRFDLVDKKKVPIAKNLVDVRAISAWQKSVAVVSGDQLLVVKQGFAIPTVLKSSGWGNIKAITWNGHQELVAVVGNDLRSILPDGTTHTHGDFYGDIIKLTCWTSSVHALTVSGDIIRPSITYIGYNHLSSGWTGVSAFAALDQI